MSFSEEMVDRIEGRAASLGLTRSAYLRQLVNDDLSKADEFPAQKGSQGFPERLRELENTVANLQDQINALMEKEKKPDQKPQRTVDKTSTAHDDLSLLSRSITLTEDETEE